jgi:aldose 1-epimerase
MSERTPIPVPLTGAQHDIEAGEYHASVTELGAGLRSLSHAGEPLVTSFEPDQLPPAGSGQLLAPWPNRIDGGRYEFGGTTYQLDLSEAAHANAIHGLTRWANWHLAGRTPNQVTMAHVLHGSPGYPFCLEVLASYHLDAADGLTVAVSASNVGSRPAPYGTGSHPYLVAGEPFVDTCKLHLEASHWLPTDDRGIPSAPPKDVADSPFDFRSPRTIGDTQLDHALTGLSRDEAGRAWARLAGDGLQVGLWAGPGYDWLQVFTGDPLGPERRRRALAVEPMTCPANAFVTGVGRLVLAPDDSVTHSWGIKVLQS